MTTSRLKTEIGMLSKRANIYIIFGSGITLVAGGFLFNTVQELLVLFNSSKQELDSGLSSLEITSLVIRFSIVVFIEIFAVYYLKLYRNIMENIKYYQNEITNIEMKALSFYTAEKGDCSESFKNLSVELSKTERNFVIDKNKTTIDLERNKQDSTHLKSTAEGIAKIVSSVKS